MEVKFLIEGNVFIYIHAIVMVLSCILTIGFGLSTFLDFDGKDKVSPCACIVSFIICVASLIFFYVGIIKCDNSDWIISETPYSVEKIMSLNDNNLTNGRFYMRRGYIEENLYYQYMVELNNGGFVVNKVNSANATLFYAEDNYRVEWYTKTKSWLYWEIEKTYNKIYIPEGSITDDYSIDLN